MNTEAQRSRTEEFMQQRPVLAEPQLGESFFTSTARFANLARGFSAFFRACGLLQQLDSDCSQRVLESPVESVADDAVLICPISCVRQLKCVSVLSEPQ